MKIYTKKGEIRFSRKTKNDAFGKNEKHIEKSTMRKTH